MEAGSRPNLPASSLLSGRDLETVAISTPDCRRVADQMLHLLSHTLMAALAVQRPAVFQRHIAPMMGGAMQKAWGAGGERLSLLVSGGAAAAADLSALCQGKECTGVVFGLPGNRVEIIAEGEQSNINQIVDAITAAAGPSATLRRKDQLPLGGYVEEFPVVTFDAKKMRAKVDMTGSVMDLDVITRNLQIEAVFNRGLKLQKLRVSDELLQLDVQGESGRLKSFIRWCYNGPPLVRADEVKVQWSEVA